MYLFIINQHKINNSLGGYENELEPHLQVREIHI